MRGLHLMQQSRLPTAPGGVETGGRASGRGAAVAVLALLALVALPGPALAKYGSPLAGIIAARREPALATAPHHPHAARSARPAAIATAAPHVDVPLPARAGGLPLLAGSSSRDRELASGFARTSARSLSPGAAAAAPRARDSAGAPPLRWTASCRYAAGESNRLRGPPLPPSAS